MLKKTNKDTKTTSIDAISVSLLVALNIYLSIGPESVFVNFRQVYKRGLSKHFVKYLWWSFLTKTVNPAAISLFKPNNRKTRKRCDMFKVNNKNTKATSFMSF